MLEPGNVSECWFGDLQTLVTMWGYLQTFVTVCGKDLQPFVTVEKPVKVPYSVGGPANVPDNVCVGPANVPDSVEGTCKRL